MKKLSKGLSFKATEKLKSTKIIEELFKKGSFTFLYPFRLYVLITEESIQEASPKVLFSVPKKKFPRAVDRNLIKRRMKEAYRLHKNEINTIDKQCYIGYIYLAKTIESYHKLDKSIVKSIKRINEEFLSQSSKSN